MFFPCIRIPAPSKLYEDHLRTPTSGSAGARQILRTTFSTMPELQHLLVFVPSSIMEDSESPPKKMPLRASSCELRTALLFFLGSPCVGMALEIEGAAGNRRFQSLVPFTKVPFWYHFFLSHSQVSEKLYESPSFALRRRVSCTCCFFVASRTTIRWRSFLRMCEFLKIWDTQDRGAGT